MNSANIALIVGNGFTIDFLRHSDKSREMYRFWDPSSPLSWIFPLFGNSPLHWSQGLPEFSAAVSLAWERDPRRTDFELFEQVTRLFNREYDGQLLESQARHFLNVAYTAFHLALRNLTTVNWYWARWIRSHAHQIRASVSFNYDLLLERCLEETGLRYSGYTGAFDGAGLPVLKPHGSIDHRSPFFVELHYPLTSIIARNDANLRRQNWSRLNEAYSGDTTVLPMEHSPFVSFTRCLEGLAAFRKAVETATHCFVLGHSYSRPDRLEMDRFLECLPRGTELVIVNPAPPDALVAKAQTLGLSLNLWRSEKPNEWRCGHAGADCSLCSTEP